MIPITQSQPGSSVNAQVNIKVPQQDHIIPVWCIVQDTKKAEYSELLFNGTL